MAQEYRNIYHLNWLVFPEASPYMYGDIDENSDITASEE